MGENSKNLGKVVSIDESRIRDHLGEMVRGTVEQTLNAMLDAEADALCGATRYERSPDRVDTRAGSYRRRFHTRAGDGVEDAQAAGSAIRDGDYRTLPSPQSLCRGGADRDVSGGRIGASGGGHYRGTVGHASFLRHRLSKLNQKVYKHIETWRQRPIEGEYPYVYLDGIVLKRSWGGEIKNVSILVAVGVDDVGYRHVLGVAEGHKEDKAGWSGFLAHLKQRGLTGVQLVISDACLGLVESVAEYYSEADWQRCTVHFYRNVFSHVPAAKMREVAAMLKAIHAQEDRAAAEQKAQQVVDKLRHMRLSRAAALVEECVTETLTYYAYPDNHWRKLKTNNPLERLMREIRRRTRVVGAFPDGYSALMLSAARLRHVASTKWGTRRYVNMELLKQQTLETHTA